MNFAGGGYQSMDTTEGGYYAYGGGGGGYMQDSQAFGASPAGDSKKSGGQSRLQTLVPLTAAQIQCTETKVDGSFVLHDKEILQVVIIGEIIEVNDAATGVMYKIDDRTGPLVEVRMLRDDQENPEQLQNRAACREGVFVRVMGSLKPLSKQKGIYAFDVRPIENFNEIYEHLSDVIYAHLAMSKGALVPEQFQHHPPQSTLASVGGGAAPWGNPVATSTQVAAGRPMYGSKADTGQNSLHHQVLDAISGSMMDQGVSIQDVVKKLSSHGFNEKQIRTAVDFLCNEGHIYSTIDDNHYKSTN